jgi:hypothetical protein
MQPVSSKSSANFCWKSQALKSATGALEGAGSVTPGLAVIIVGDDPAGHAYVGAKDRRAKEFGFNSVQHTLPGETTRQELANLVRTLNADPSIHGILVQLPLPRHLNSDPIIQSILLEKDVDGLNVDPLALNLIRFCWLKWSRSKCRPLFSQPRRGRHLSAKTRAIGSDVQRVCPSPIALVLSKTCSGRNGST